MKYYPIVYLVLLIVAFNTFAERADRDKPIHLEADRATVEDVDRRDAVRISVFTGNVILTQGTLRINADKVVIKEDTIGFRHATATGNLVSFRQKRDGVDEYIEGWSKRVEYDSRTEKIELFKLARLKRGEDEVNGDYISYNMNSEFFQVIGNNELDGDSGKNGRVQIIIQPKNKSTADSTTVPSTE